MVWLITLCPKTREGWNVQRFAADQCSQRSVKRIRRRRAARQKDINLHKLMDRPQQSSKLRHNDTRNLLLYRRVLLVMQNSYEEASATFTMHDVSSITIMPPDPMIEPAASSAS